MKGKSVARKPTESPLPASKEVSGQAMTLVNPEVAQVSAMNSQALPEPIEQGKTTTLRAISIRLPVADIELAKKIAGKRGIGYQTLLKHAIREGLRKAG